VPSSKKEPDARHPGTVACPSEGTLQRREKNRPDLKRAGVRLAGKKRIRVGPGKKKKDKKKKVTLGRQGDRKTAEKKQSGD